MEVDGFVVGGVALEDTDPYRDCHHWDVLGRLSGDDAGRWARLLPAAWDLIQEHHGVYAPGIAAGLSTIVPLAPGVAGNDVSATARHAFGSIGAALPAAVSDRGVPDAAALALLLIHEFQHVKLGAVIDMADLHDRTDARLFHAPWRPDPRPLEGLLQGTYAHVGVTDFWRVRSVCAPSSREREHAAREFRRWYGHTDASIDLLIESGSLTPLGLRFAAGMRASIDEM